MFIHRKNDENISKREDEVLEDPFYKIGINCSVILAKARIHEFLPYGKGDARRAES